MSSPKCNILIPNQILTIDDFCTSAECQDFIQRAERVGFDEAPITTATGFVRRPSVRNNTRVMIDDPDLAESLWERVRSFIPAELEGCVPVGLNERFRFYRYDENQFFAPHYDGCFRRPNGEESLLTLMVYLNEDFVGGETRFDLKFPHPDISILPKEGMVLCFFHYLRHEGAPVGMGRKYVLRTDVMFRKIKTDTSQ
ncbi:MAG TPA: 2OG-Fe(II) oxygenase [Acidobacteriota bacterium]|nr:2OG-Fe(II) oxygenase [Acidobacteriota bacterium]HNH85350.1 2OG-Fe(II) oxygenase [Acidobacteriota bacterium]HNJ44272.1 2OG-Fe(II) oxygenase [Acidobacteriota bacterium]